MTVPKWNLEQDWPDRLKPKDTETGLPAVLFSPPLEKLTVPDHNYSLSLDNSTTGIKKLVIDIQTGQQVNALAVLPGVVSATATSVTLRTGLLSALGVTSLLSDHQQKSEPMPVGWFRDSWIFAGLIPETITLENVIASKTSGTVDAGEVLGSLGNHPADPSKRRLVISIEYSGSSTKNTKAMHPREFFSLLFWRAEHDPILQANPTPYDHPLLRSMMATAEDGMRGPVDSFINAPKDTWLGLRPPLRVYERVKWEHIKEHLRNDYAPNQPEAGPGSWDPGGSVQKRIQNPYVFNGGTQGYRNKTKCNIYAGEMLFRAGFRTLAFGQGIGGCTSGHLPRVIKYCSPKILVKHFKTEYRIKGQIHYDTISTGACSGSSTPTHEIFTVFGEPVTCSAKTINDLIERQGAVYVVANSSLVPPNIEVAHVAIVDKVVSCSHMVGTVARRELETVQQWHGGFSRDSYAQTWPGAVVADSVVLRMRPGGDPTENWGALDLNCLCVLDPKTGRCQLVDGSVAI